MRAVDTNVLIRLLTRDDPAQLRAAEDFVQHGAWISQLVLMEAAWVLEAVYGVRKKELARGLEMLLDHERLVVQEPDVVAAALAAFTRPRAPGFSDCLILAVARKAGHLPMGTFDRGLAKLEGAERLAVPGRKRA